MLGKILLSLLLVVVPAKSIDLTKTQTYVSKNHVYMYIAPGIFTGAEGHLFYDDAAVLGKRRNQIVKTPWGSLFWHAMSTRLSQPEGWLPYSNPRFPVPKSIRASK